MSKKPPQPSCRHHHRARAGVVRHGRRANHPFVQQGSAGVVGGNAGELLLAEFIGSLARPCQARALDVRRGLRHGAPPSRGRCQGERYGMLPTRLHCAHRQPTQPPACCVALSKLRRAARSHWPCPSACAARPRHGARNGTCRLTQQLVGSKGACRARGPKRA